MRRFLDGTARQRGRKAECGRLRPGRLPVISHTETAARRIAAGRPIASTGCGGCRFGRSGPIMATTSGTTTPSAGNQRDALNESQKKANEQQPGSYKEKETDDKVVEIPPKGPDSKPIRGLDS
jgi:hypothetical protein